MHSHQGTGTAIGELPPYFMARAARLHGQVAEEEGEVEDIMLRGSQVSAVVLGFVSVTCIFQLLLSFIFSTSF